MKLLQIQHNIAASSDNELPVAGLQCECIRFAELSELQNEGTCERNISLGVIPSNFYNIFSLPVQSRFTETRFAETLTLNPKP